jgi:hypothetical protein
MPKIAIKFRRKWRAVVEKAMLLKARNVEDISRTCSEGVCKFVSAVLFFAADFVDTDNPKLAVDDQLQLCDLVMVPLAEESLTRPKFVCKMLSLLFRHLRGAPVVALTDAEFQGWKVRCV